MDTPSVPLKQCRNKGNCVHPEARDGWLPATTEYFRYRKDTGKFRGDCLACVREYTRQYAETHKVELKEYLHNYYGTNRDAIQQQHRDYYLAHLDTTRERSKRYRETHRSEIHERDRRYIKANRSHMLQRHKEYYLEHRAERIEHQRHYHKMHPEVGHAGSARRRGRKRANGGTFTLADVQLILRSQKHLCWWCGKLINGRQYHIDHRVPISRGGSNAPENLCIACPECNLSKHTKLPQEWNGRLL